MHEPILTYAQTPYLRLRVKKDLHLLRKFWHCITGVLIAGIYSSMANKGLALFLLSSLFIVSFGFELLRLKKTDLNERIVQFWAPLMREHEVKHMSTMPHYLAAALISVAVFPKAIAILSILYLAFGDPMASLVGLTIGHLGPKISNNRTLFGTLASVCTCSVISFFYLSHLPIFSQLILSIIGGMAGGFAEILPFDVDDNLSIPLVSGFVLWFSFLIIGL